jgi:hypothetical protein
MQKTYLPVWQTLQMSGVSAENYSSVWQTVQMTELTAENCLHAWQTSQMTGVTAESRLLPWKTLLITLVTAEDRLPAWQTLQMTNLPLYFQSSFHMWLSITLLVCSHISQKSAQLWQNNIKQWSSSTQLISTTPVWPSLNSLKTKKTTTYHVENPGSGLEQALNVGFTS